MPTGDRTASFRRRAKICGWVGVATLALGVWTSRAGSLRSRNPLPEGVKSPVIALELIRSPQLLDQIARPDVRVVGDMPAPRPRRERERLVYAVEVDTFAFIPAYTAFLILIGWLVSMTVHRRVRFVGAIVVATAVAGAVFDVRENLAMLALLGGAAADPRSPSLMKWGLLGVAVLCSVPLFLHRPVRLLLRSIGYLGIVLAVGAGIGAVFGAASGNDTLIESAAGRLGATFLVVVVFLLGLEPLRDGLVPALNALAEKWPLNKLVEWPSGDEDETVGEPVFPVKG